jgi:transcriptional regulator with AAA-type ATPase domain
MSSWVQQDLVYENALRYLWDSMEDLNPWFRSLTPRQVEDVARIMSRWHMPPRDLRVSVAPRQAQIRTMAALELDAILEAVRLCNGNVAEAAKALGIGRTTIYRKLQSWEQDCKSLMQAAALKQNSPSAFPELNACNNAR